MKEKGLEGDARSEEGSKSGKTCGECGATFKKPYHLRRHMLTHSFKRTFVCPVKGCSSSCKLKYHLQIHLREHHKDPSSEGIKLVGADELPGWVVPTLAENAPEVVKSKAAYNTPFSHTRGTSVVPKQVYLMNWCLWKPGSKGIGVEGYAVIRGQAEGLFRSSEITKRHDSSTLESSDGIKIYISGLIDSVRTMRSGFSSEVCRCFLSGFPLNWEDWEKWTESSGFNQPENAGGEIPVWAECSNGISAEKIHASLLSISSDCEEHYQRDIILSSIGITGTAEPFINQDQRCGIQNFENPEGQSFVSCLRCPKEDISKKRVTKSDDDL